MGDGQWLVHNTDCRTGLIDNNILYQAYQGNQNAIDFLETNRSSLGVGPQTMREFLDAPNATRADLGSLIQRYDLEIFTPHYPAIDGDARNLQNLFQNARGNRSLKPGDANILAEGESLGLTVYTNDRLFANRMIDLSARGEYVDLHGTSANPSAAFIGVQNYRLNINPKLKVR